VLHAGGIGRNRHYEPISGFTALLTSAVTGQVLSIQRRRTIVPQVVTLIAGSIAGDEEMFMTRSLNVTPKTTEQRISLHAVINL